MDKNCEVASGGEMQKKNARIEKQLPKKHVKIKRKTLGEIWD